jgi:hypothetical protein
LQIYKHIGDFLKSLNETTYSNYFKVHKYKSLILFSTCSNTGFSNLRIFDDNLRLVGHLDYLKTTSEEPVPITCLCANASFIYYSFSIDENSSLIYALNWRYLYLNYTHSYYYHKIGWNFRLKAFILCFKTIG